MPYSTRPDFCAREGEDAVRDIFCGEEPAILRSLQELESRLALDSSAEATGTSGYDSDAVYRSVVLLGHSTALSGRFVSPINPRVIVIGINSMLAFNRGTQQVEIVSRDRKTIGFNFYLVSFEQACNAAKEGCRPGDLYTPSIESDWTRIQVHDAEELKNTPSDCRQCHQRGRDTPVLLMRELLGPWTHFFFPAEGEVAGFPEPTGFDLMHDYLGAKGNEVYAGIPAQVLSVTLGESLEGVVDPVQPLIFDAPRIVTERWPYGPDGYPTEPQRSPTWDAAYEAFKRGEQLALPYFEPRPTDAEKQAALTEAYQKYQAGAIDAASLPDLSDIFPDDPQVRAEIGLQIEPSATPAEMLVQACGSCHNDVLDQGISRARFNIDLGRLDRAELDLAMARVQLPRGAPGCMPPADRRQLDAEGRKSLVAYLQRSTQPEEDRAFLARAAKLGMMGGAEQ